MLLAVTLNVGAGWSVMATGVAQMLVFALMQAFSVTVVGTAIGLGAVYVFELVPEAGEPCTVIAVVAGKVPAAALDGEGVIVQVSPVAVPSFWIDAVKPCVFPAVSEAGKVGGMSVMLVAGMVKFVVAQTVVHTDAHPCTVTFRDGAAISAVSVKVVDEQLLAQETEPNPTPLMMEKLASCGF